MTTLQDALQKVEQLRTEAQEVAAALHRQQEILRLREIALETGLLGLSQMLAPDLERVERTMLSDEKDLTQLRVLAETTALINSTLDFDTVLPRALDAVLRLTSAGRGYVFLRDDSGEPVIRVARKQEPDDDNNGDESVSRTVVRQVLKSGEALLTDNASQDPRVAKSSTVARFTLRSILCVPLISKGVVEGAIYVDNRTREGVFTERELNLLTAFANQIAVAVENARLFSSVQASVRELAQATELMQNVFASIASGVITTNSQDAVSAYNAAAASILNVAPEAALTQPLRSLLPALGEEFEAALVAAKVRNQSKRFEAETEIVGRGRIALNLKIDPLKNADGQTEGVAMVLDDLTAKRERDQTLDLLRRYLPPGMVESIHEISRLSMGGERREVTCMFIDVGVLTQYAGELAPPAMMDRLNVYLESLTDVIHEMRGVIDKYMGSDLMVLFNTQLNSQHDHAERAVKTALALREAFAALDARHAQTTPHYRIGIHTGIATLGNVGGIQRRSFTALGDSINLAKRLQENARGGQTIISEDTLQAIKAAGDADWLREGELPPIQVKGRQQSTRIYEVSRP